MLSSLSLCPLGIPAASSESGIAHLLTAGVFGILWIVDLFTLPSQVRMVNTQRSVGIG